jgi:hypothetical protein
MSSRTRFASDTGADATSGSATAGGTASPARVFRQFLIAGVLAVAGCSPSGPAPDVRLSAAEWHEFQGTWTATGSRQAIRLGPDRRASIAKLEGTLLLAGPGRPGAGFRAEAIVLTDSATGMVGRAVWTDEHGDEAYSELRGEGTATGNRIEGAAQPVALDGDRDSEVGENGPTAPGPDAEATPPSPPLGAPLGEPVKLDDGVRSRKSGAAYRARGLLEAEQIRALRAGARRDMLWRADDPAPGLAAIGRAVKRSLARPVRHLIGSGR